MRWRCLLVLGLVLVPRIARAAEPVVPGRSVGAVVQSESVILRGGPGLGFEATGVVLRGTPLQVVGEADGWVRVVAPARQFSWIRNVFVADADAQGRDRFPYDAVVNADTGAEIRVGAENNARPLPLSRVTVPDGTIVRVIGPSVVVDNLRWTPIEPPAGDTRFLPQDSVKFTGQTTAPPRVTTPATASARPDSAFQHPEVPPTPPGGNPAPANPTPGANPSRPLTPGEPDPYAGNATWAKARAHEQAGELEAAEALYRQLAQQQAREGGDAELSRQCFFRIHAIRVRQSGLTPVPARPAGSGSSTGPTAQTPPAPTTPPTRPVGGFPAPSADAQVKPRWVSPGTLRTTTLRTDGRTTYALAQPGNNTACYVVGDTGIDLSKFVGYRVDLYGTVSYPENFDKVPLVTVTRAQVTPENTP